ncbi:MAG: hypothetical protein ABSF97_05480 [Candidatus Sulfotelmatobacter sp.]|jgi:hypothetical protein
MRKRGNSTLMESTLLLALMGILAGAVGGLAVGVATGPKATSAVSATK